MIRHARYGKTVVGGQGELLRGAALWSFRYRSEQLAQQSTPDQNLDPVFWDQMKAEGINAVRFVFFDPWQRSHGNASDNVDRPYPFLSLLPEDVVVQGGTLEVAEAVIAANKAALTAELNQIADLAAERRMYVMINYHDSFGYEDPIWSTDATAGPFQFPFQAGSTRYLDAFWDLVAPLMKDRKNVFFELMNEPVAYHPNNYEAKDVQAIKDCYQRVRTMAPDTHLVLGSFSNTAHFGDRSMLKVTQELEQAGVSFDNASISFHPYDTTDLLPHSPRNFRQLMWRYPVINSEQGYPTGVVAGSQDPDARGFGRHLLGTQSMERYNVSWFAWKTMELGDFQANYVGIIKPDAQHKRYAWSWELAWADRLNDLEARRGFVSRYLYSRMSQVFQLLTFF